MKHNNKHHKRQVFQIGKGAVLAQTIYTHHNIVMLLDSE